MYRTEIINRKEKGKTNQKWLVCQSDCPEDVFDYIQKHKPFVANGVANCDSKGVGDGWAESKNLNHALEIGRWGWPKGRELMVGEIERANLIRRALPRHLDGMDVSGTYPLVPLFVAGEPACFVTHGMEKSKTKPVVRIVVNAAVSGAVTAATIMRRGAAILSWVDELEAVGIRCEIEVIETGLFKEREENQLGVLFSVTGKGASEPLDIDRCAFLLCHPSIQRRIFFGLYERVEDQLKLGLSPQEAVTYGSPTDDISEDWIGLHSVYFPAMLRNNDDYASPANAVAAVERAIMKGLQLTEVEEDLEAMKALEAEDKKEK